MKDLLKRLHNTNREIACDWKKVDENFYSIFFTDDESYEGEGWDSPSFEINSSLVKPSYVKYSLNVFFPKGTLVVEPNFGIENTGIRKNEFKDNVYPFLHFVHMPSLPEEDQYDIFDYDFFDMKESSVAHSFCLNDEIILFDLRIGSFNTRYGLEWGKDGISYFIF